MTLNTAVQTPAPGDRVTLYDLDATAIGGGYFRFTPDVVGPGQSVTFNGHVYAPLPVEADGFEWSGKGAAKRPTLRISNVQKAVAAAVISLGDLTGALITRTKTFRQYLDDGAEADPTQTFPPDIYFLERKTEHNKLNIQWELRSAMDVEGAKLPKRLAVRDYCSHRYRVFDPETGDFDYSKVTCPYTGAASYDIQHREVASPFDLCPKSLAGCRARFGQNAVLPTRAFPGMARIR